MDPSSLPRFAAYDVEVDVPAGRLTRDGSAQHLRQKAFEVLVYLVGHRDRVVSRDELFDEVWPGVAVTEDTLVQCIVDIRRALGDQAREPRFVQTVLKRGYRFIAPIRFLPTASGALNVELETTTSFDLEIVSEESDAPVSGAARPAWRMVAAVGAGLLSLAALAGYVARTRDTARPAAAIVPDSLDAMTADHEALKLYSEGLERAAAFRQDEAIALFERALGRDPEFAMARARIGYVRAVIGNARAAALPDLDKALASPQRLTAKDRILIEAWRSIANADYAAAIERYRLIVDRYPTDGEAHQALARLLVGEEQLAEAIAVLERARDIDPRDPNVHNMLGIYSNLGRHDDSIAARKQYVELRPHEPNAWDSLGGSYHWAGRYREALDAYARALELNPGFDIARYHRAATLVQLGRFRDAIRDVQDCLAAAKEPQAAGRAWSTLADIHRLMGDDAGARDAASRIPESVWKPTLTDVQAGEVNEVAWRRRAELIPVFGGRGARGELRFQLVLEGYSALRRGDHAAALEILRRATRTRSPMWHVDPHETALGDALFSLTRYQEASEEYARVLGRTPNYARARLGLARSLDRLGQRARARAEYESFLDLWKDADRDAADLASARAAMARLR